MPDAAPAVTRTPTARTAGTAATAGTSVRRSARNSRAPRPRARSAEPETLLAFGARWCPPWQLLSSHLDALEADGVLVERVDVDDDPAAAERHRIISVPTVIVMRGTEERRRILGATNREALAALLQRRRG